MTENASAGTLVGTVDASDPGDDTLTFSITGGTGDADSVIDSGSGQIRVAEDAVLDYEGVNSFDLQVTVTDGDGGADTADVQIDLINLPSITGVVFVDVDNDGQFDANEPGIDDVRIDLRDGNGDPLVDHQDQAISSLTSDGGFYLFEDLAPGTYQVHQRQPSGVVDGADIPGTPGGTVVANDTLQVTLTDQDAFDFAFAEIGQQVSAGDTAGIGFWQSKHGQN